MLINSNTYNHLNSGLVLRKRNTTHKSSELKAVCSSMSKYNKNSPLYLLSLSESNQEHMINIKESALTLRDIAESFSNPDSDVNSKKLLHSDDEESVTGAFKGHNTSLLPDELTIEITSLARQQVNIGSYVKSNESSLYSREHNFTLQTIGASSHFSISVAPNEPNISIQDNIVRYINNRNLGVSASILSDGDSSAIMLVSDDTGVPSTEDGLYFTFSGSTSGSNIIDLFGLNNISSYPADSSFKINDEEHTSTSNHISINRVIELDFHKETLSPVNISFVPDTNMVKEQLNMFADAYNCLVDLSRAGGKINVGSRSLLNDISIIVDNHRDELLAAGLQTDDKGHIKNIDEASPSLSGEKMMSLFGSESTLSSDIFNATQRLTIDPAAYINKLLVTYPNAHNKLNASYTKSVYSGLIYNNYA